MKVWPLAIAGAIGAVVIYYFYNRRGRESSLYEFPEPDPSTPQTPMKLTAEQYERFGYPYGMSYDNWLIHGQPVYKGGTTVFPPNILPLTTKPSDTTMVIPATKEYIYYYGSSQIPEFLTPATFLRVKPPALPKPQPWNYTNYYDQF